MPYQGWVSAAVGGFKYRDETARAPSLAIWLVPLLRDLGHVDALLPVPLHPRRRRKRGYNQAELLASELSNLSGVPLKSALVRTRHTPPQVGRDMDQRLENVQGAFGLASDHGLSTGKRYVVVDDVRTTGATLGACAAALASESPGWIGALTLAWTVPAGLHATLADVHATPP